jgi:hypothetical protein
MPAPRRPHPPGPQRRPGLTQQGLAQPARPGSARHAAARGFPPAVAARQEGPNDPCHGPACAGEPMAQGRKTGQRGRQKPQPTGRHPDERSSIRLHALRQPSERSARLVANSAAIRHLPRDPALGVPPPPLLWGRSYCRWLCRGRRGPHMPLVRCLRMGSFLPGSCGAESRGWRLVPHYCSLRICPNLSPVNTRRATVVELQAPWSVDKQWHGKKG